VLETVASTLVTVSDLLEITGQGPIWESGFLEYRGLKIKIRDWDEVTTPGVDVGRVDTSFLLVEQPPASWLGQVLRCVSGCSKTVESCRERYDNEKNFCGAGHGILPYNPMIEDSPNG
jgi:hypothetical protein